MFEFDGKPVNTVGDVLDAANKASLEGRAQEFLAVYRAANEHADENLGYIFGYTDKDTRKRLHADFSLSHPIFGNNY